MNKVFIILLLLCSCGKSGYDEFLDADISQLRGRVSDLESRVLQLEHDKTVCEDSKVDYKVGDGEFCKTFLICTNKQMEFEND